MIEKDYSPRGTPAPCGCEWETGTWTVCDAHRVPHSQHVTPAPGCDLCDSALDESREVLSETELDDDPEFI